MPARELRQITEMTWEGSRKDRRASGTGKQDVPGSRGGRFFFFFSALHQLAPNCRWFPGFLQFPKDLFSPERLSS